MIHSMSKITNQYVIVVFSVNLPHVCSNRFCQCYDRIIILLLYPQLKSIPHLQNNSINIARVGDGRANDILPQWREGPTSIRRCSRGIMYYTEFWPHPVGEMTASIYQRQRYNNLSIFFYLAIEGYYHVVIRKSLVLLPKQLRPLEYKSHISKIEINAFG